MTSRDIIGWIRWANSADDEFEVDRRNVQVWKHVFPDGLEPVERLAREALIEQVKLRGEPPEDWKGWPEATPLPEEKVTLPEITASYPLGTLGLPSESKTAAAVWDGLIPPTSKAHRRGSLHDGTERELRMLRTLSRGSPFEVELPPPAPPARPKWK